MARFIEFEGGYQGRYNNALHASYHAAQYEVLDKRATLDERVHISDAKKEEYHGYVLELQDRNKEAQKNTDTRTARKTDSERDRLLSMLFFILNSGLTALDDALRAAAEYLSDKLSLYKGIQNEADDSETASIRGLITDMRKEENQEAVTTLNLDSLLTQLETANNSFAETQAQRRELRQNRYLQLSTDELRKLTDETLGEIQDLIRSSGVIASVTEGQEDTVTFAEQLINEMNGVTRDFKITLRQMEAQREVAKRKAEGSAGTGTEPETPEEPTEDTEKATEN